MPNDVSTHLDVHTYLDIIREIQEVSNVASSQITVRMQLLSLMQDASRIVVQV